MNRWAIVEGHYWFYTHYHRGQFSWEYKRLCKIQKYFKPGLLQTECEDKESQDVYNQLVGKHVKFNRNQGSRRTV